MARKEGDKNWLESVLSNVTQPLWGGRELTEEEVADMKRYSADPEKYVRDARANIFHQGLNHSNAITYEQIAAAEAANRADREQRERDQEAP